MITETQLNEAIAECNGQRNPNAATCYKLASYLTIKREMFPDKTNDRLIDTGYSYTGLPVAETSVIDYDSNTEFAKAVNGRKINEILAVLDEIMTGVYVVDPPLYRRIMRDLTA